MLEIRKKNFETQFKTVWGSSKTEISIATVTLESPEMAEKLIAALYNKTLVADVHNFFNVPRYTKSHLFHEIGHHKDFIAKEMTNRLMMVTTDDRVAELIEECVDVTGDENSDIMIRTLTGISSEFKKWATLQTQPKYDIFSFNDVDPWANSKPVSFEKIHSVNYYL